VRRHIPGTLARIPAQASMDALVAVLSDPDGFLRFKAVAAIGALRRRHPELTFAPAAVETLIHRETARYFTYLSLRANIRDADSLIVRALTDKLARTLDRIYNQLGLLYPWKDIAAARRTIESGDAHARASAVEYLDTLLAGPLRKRVMPILEDMPEVDRIRHANSVMKTRPRDLEDTLAQLLHDEDPVVAASAIDLVAQLNLEALADDLEYLIEKGPSNHLVLDAANWALALRSARRGPNARDASAAPLPVVEIADRLRSIRLFEFVSIDELFRIAATARQTRYERGRDLARQGTHAHEVFFLVEGSVRLSGGGSPDATVAAPAALAFEDMLVDRPLRRTMTADGAVISVALSGSDFLTMLSDNIAMAQGLFQMLLADRAELAVERHAASPALPLLPSDLTLNHFDKALLLRQNPLLGGASVTQLLELAVVTREVTLSGGAPLASGDEPPAAYHLLGCEVQLEDGSGPPITVGPGRTVYLMETLAGIAPRNRAVVTRGGTALRIDQDELFDVLSDHLDLLQGVFSGVLNAIELETAKGESS
jgi:hypothetical protein